MQTSTRRFLRKHRYISHPSSISSFKNSPSLPSKVESMAERPDRRKLPFGFRIPPWSIIYRASQRPTSRRKTQPSSASESPPQGTQTLQEPIAVPTAPQAKAPPSDAERNGEASQRPEHPSQAEYETDEAHVRKTTQPQEDEQHAAFQTILVETVQDTKRESDVKQVTRSELEPPKDQQLESAQREQSLSPEAKLENISGDEAEMHLVAEQTVQPSDSPKAQMLGEGQVNCSGEIEQKISPIQTTVEKATEELKSEEGEALKEDRHDSQVTEEPKKESKPKLSISVSDSKTKNRAFIYEGKRISELEKVEEQVNGTHQDSTSSFPGKENKIKICAMPRSSTPNLGRPDMQKELKDGLSRLVQKLSVAHQNKQGNEQGVSIITLAGENKGASMFIGSEGFSGEERTYIHRGHKPEKGIKSSVLECAHPVSASINSNVQGINNSVLDETTYSENNPGVHMIISTKPTAAVDGKGRIESPEAQNAASIPATAEKLTYEPNIRRRCLRGLFLESSEDDIQNPQKPRRHGCRFSCDDKRKAKAEDDANVKS